MPDVPRFRYARVDPRARGVVLVGLAALVLSLSSPAARASSGLATSSTPLASSSLPVLASLVAEPEQAIVSYSREAFRHWTDADGDGCDTRAEVLERDSAAPVVVSSSCTVLSGSWSSWYDGRTWSEASDVDIDHVVPLREAWFSGADSWTDSRREAFANDLGLTATLQVVTDDINSTKGAQDPAGWLPSNPSATCGYMVGWVLVKYRWQLSVDAAEAAVLRDGLVACGDPDVELPEVVDPGPPPSAPEPVTSPFVDVPDDHPFRAEIALLAGTGVTTGYADGTFGPGLPVSRQAFAAYLYRFSHAGADAPPCTQQWFVDVPVSSGFCGEVTWLAGTGLSTGYQDGTFRPTAPISRQAMATLVHRYRVAADSTTDESCDPLLFPDTGGGPFCGPITWLAATGITTGYPDGSFRPTVPVSRQAMAAYLYRYQLQFEPSVPPVVVAPPRPTPPPLPPPTAPPNPGDSRNCGDFATYAQAHAWYALYFPYYGDVARLDSDGDRIPCETLPGAP